MNTTEPSTKVLNGHTAMYAWNPTWRPHDIPRWAKKPMRAYRRQACELNGYPDPEGWLQTKYWQIVDHWGSIEDSTGKRVLIMCPYGRHDDVAAKLAEIIGAQSWTCAPRGPWHSDTFLYIFNP